MYILSGNKEKCELLKDFAYQEKFILENYAKTFGYTALQRYAIFDNGAIIRTLYTKTVTKTEIYYPDVKVEEPIKVKIVNELIIKMYEVDLVSAVNSYSAFYSIQPGSITKATDLSMKENQYTVFNSYFTLDETDFDIYEESCVCIINGVSNIAADNIYLTSTSHKDDWHQKKFLWVAFPYDWAVDYQLNLLEDTWGHPGLEARASGKKFHWSHSEYTYGSSKSHVVRSIDPEKRIYRPGMVNLEYDDGSKQYHMTSLLRKEYGKTPWTRDSNGKIVTYNERVEADGSGTWTMNQPTDNWVMYLWPFIPYLWEIPYFFVFSWTGNDALYGCCYIPTSGLGSRNWNYKYTALNGIEYTELKHTDVATFTGSPVVKTSSTAPRPHYVWDGPYSMHLEDGPISNTWVDTANESCNWSCSINKIVPVGTLCNGDSLFVSNTVSLSSSYTYNSTTTHTKDTSFGDTVYLWYPSYPEMWGDGTWLDTSSINSSTSHTTIISGSVNSVLQAGSVVIETGVGVLSYNGVRIVTGAYDGTYGFSRLGGEYTDPINTGTSSSNSQTNITCDRSMVCFDILDYDSESNFNYDNIYVKAFALIYKRITVSSAIPRTISITSNIDCGSAQANIISNGGGFNSPAPRDPTESEITKSDQTSPTGTRKVEYILYANVDGHVYNKTLATFNGGIGTGTGQRVYGVVVKLMQDHLIVSYDLDNFITTANAQSATSYYDSPLNFEDWNSNLNVQMWETSKRVVGIVALSDSSDWATELFDEQNPLDNEVYGINMTENEITVQI